MKEHRITRENYNFWRAEAEILRKPGLPMSIYDEGRVKIFSKLLDFWEEDNERLRADNDRLRGMADEFRALMVKVDQLDEKDAEIERLRATLNQTVKALDLAQALLERSRHHPEILEAYKQARAALAGKEDKG